MTKYVYRPQPDRYGKQPQNTYLGTTQLEYGNEYEISDTMAQWAAIARMIEKGFLTPADEVKPEPAAPKPAKKTTTKAKAKEVAVPEPKAES